ncbi:MAG TPA: hypothetical protein VHS34_04455 [Terriglobales bacterium]|nr:hypothetical protein [Terriglobales bacterium]
MKFFLLRVAVVLVGSSLLFSSMHALAQDGDTGSSMPGMDATETAMPHMQSHSLIESLLQHTTSGTDAEPNSTPATMLMTTKGGWMLMFHGEGFLSELQQSGPRGADKLFSTNWWMPMAQRKFGKGTLTIRTMLSFEPATVSNRRYPELFQQGETAFGRPIVDGQHPHDFFMELAALYDYKLAEHTLLSLYAAPMGDPAMGPIAYPHRASASEDPVAPLGHHLQDSTHIAADVITVGITHHNFRLEASGFYGREPDESRWNINSGKIDSWSTRVTANPGQNWSVQYSIAQLRSPESLAPDEDVRRMTASVQYNRPLREGNWASMLVWGRNQDVAGGNVGNSFLLESTLRFLQRNYVWTRIENVDRTNELLLGETPEPAGFSERYFTRVQAYTAGYEREVGNIPHLSTALGAQVTWYGVPASLKTAYGSHPVGALVFLRVRPR